MFTETIEKREVDLWQEVKKQYRYKWRLHANMFSIIIVYQLGISLLNLLGSMGSYYTNPDGFMDVNIEYFDTVNIIAFTLVWAFFMGVSLTTKSSKVPMLTFITSKMSNHLANGMFIMLLSLVGGITAWLAEYLIQTVIIVTIGVENIHLFNTLSFADVLTTGIASILYVFLFIVLGYLVGEFSQGNLTLAIMFIACILFVGINISPFQIWIGHVVAFYMKETSVIMFTLKVLSSVVILYIIALVPGKKLEVR